MNSKRSHNFIKAILFALTVTLVMTGAAFAWGQVYAAEGTGSGAHSDMQNYDAAPAERVYGIYMLFGDDPRVYVEWLGETELPEDAVLVIEKKEEMTEEEAAEYQAAFDELIVKPGAGDPGADGLVEPGTEEGDDSTAGEDDAAGNSDAGEATGTDGDPDAAGTDGGDDAGEDGKTVPGQDAGDEGAGNEDGSEEPGSGEEPAGNVDDPGTDPSEGQGSDEKPASQAAAKQAAQQAAKQAAQQAAKQAAKQAAQQAAGMMKAANVPKENAQDAQTADGGTRDVVPTGIFTGSKLGMILVVLLVAFASAIFFIRSRNQDEY